MARRTARMRRSACGLAMLCLLLGAGLAQADPPSVEYQVFGTLGSNGWYVDDVTIVWSVTLTNGPPPYDSDNCGPTTDVTSDTPPAGVTTTCTASNGDGTVQRPVVVHRDATKPSVASATPSRAADHAGWFNHPVNVAFAGSDASSGIASCATVPYAGPDSASAPVAGTCRDVAGNVSAPAALALKYDATAPEVDGFTPEHPADFLGWFTRPVALTFTGSDATSGIADCDSVAYSGPDSPSAPISGGCRDVAGNANAATFAVSYDATAPALTQVAAAAGDSTATLSWNAGDANLVRITRKPGPSRPLFEGSGRRFSDMRLRNGVRYSYTVTALDAAGHSSSRTVSARPSSRLLAPSAGASVKAPPRLRWKKVRKASYYNVQLFRGKNKILSAWPRRARLQLASAWRYGGLWRRLSPGTYRWYVWPGYGERSQRRYGRVLGTRLFTMG